MGDKIGHHGFCTSLRQTFIVLRRTLVVAVGTELDGHMGIFVEQRHQFIKSRLGRVAQRSLIEIIEDVVDECRRRDVCQGELQGCVSAFFGIDQCLDLFLMVEIAFASGKKEIADTGIQHLGERSVAVHTHLLIGPIIADDIDLSGRKLIAVHLVDPPLDRLHDLRVDKRVDMIPATCVATVAGEESTVVRTLEGHAEVIALGVERIAGMG